MISAHWLRMIFNPSRDRSLDISGNIRFIFFFRISLGEIRIQGFDKLKKILYGGFSKIKKLI